MKNIFSLILLFLSLTYQSCDNSNACCTIIEVNTAILYKSPMGENLIGTTSNGVSGYYCGGGGGGADYYHSGGGGCPDPLTAWLGAGGSGGGGSSGGCSASGPVATAGTGNTGGGGAGISATGQQPGSAGGSGIIIIRYKFQN